MLSKIISIEENEIEDTMDISTDGDHTFYANGILTHNSGISIDFKEVNYDHIGESISIAAAADFMAIMGRDTDDMVYDSEILWKIVKNRFGGRVSEIGRFYMDKRSLKYYDETELQQWMNDATSTKDERTVVQKY